MTWRRLVASPITSMGSEAWKVTGQSGPTVDAVWTASAHSATRSTDRCSMGRPSSSRASRSRSATRCSIRAVSVRIPPISRSRSAFCSEAPAPEQLGVGRDGGDGGAQLVGGVGHEAAQPGLGGPQPPLRGHPGAEGRLDAGQHDVEGPGQPPDLGLVVLAGDPLGQVAGGDGLGGGLHVAERAQADADQPEAAEEGDDDGRSAVTASSTRSRWWSVLPMSPSGWATISRSPLCSIEARTLNSGPPAWRDGALK